MVARSQTITVSDHQGLISYHKFLRLSVYGDTKLHREIIKHPHVVVTCKKGYRNPCISQFSKLTLESDKTLWDGVFVLKPEIKNIAHQINGMRFVLDAIQPFYDQLLSLQT